MPRRKTGFTLVIVIRGVGLIILICVTAITTARWRLAAVENISLAAKAQALAEAAEAIALTGLSRGGLLADHPRDGLPIVCALPQGAIAAVAIEDEGGKVDLNGASEQILEALFAGMGTEPWQAAAIGKAIVAFRTVLPAGGAPEPASVQGSAGISPGVAPKHGLFQTISELDQVAPISPRTFARVLPYVTVSTGRAGVDPRLSPPALFAALSGRRQAEVDELIKTPYPNALARDDPRFPLRFVQLSGGAAVTIHVEVTLPTGTLVARDTLASLAGAGGKAVIRETRRAAPRYQSSLIPLLGRGGATLAPC